MASQLKAPALRQLPIFYINLTSRPDRRAFMERQFGNLGLQAERIKAFTPAQIGAADRRLYCNPDRRRWMTVLEFACNMSHAAAWRRLLASGAGHGLILEDDALLSRSLPRLLEAVEAGTQSPPVIRIETLGGEARRMGPVERHILPDVGLRRCYTRDAGAGGYILTRQAAEFLLRRPEMKVHLVDAVLFNPFSPLAASLDVRYCDPALSIQMSCIGDEGAEAVSDLDAGRDQRRRESSRRPLLKWANKVASWIDYDAPMTTARLRQLGRRDIRATTVRFEA